METNGSVAAVFADHAHADAAVKTLADAGIPLTRLSVIGKGYHTEETATGFCNTGDRMRFWGSRGAFSAPGSRRRPRPGPRSVVQVGLRRRQDRIHVHLS